MERNRTDEPLAAAQGLVADIGVLIRNELEEAKIELAGKIRAAGLGAGMVSASAFAGLMTVICFSALIAVLLSSIVAPWAAVLTITVLWAVAAVALGWLGKRKVDAARPFFPEQTIEHIKEDIASARRSR